MSTHPPIVDPVLTTEAARILNVSQETVRQWERRGILPAHKTARGVRLFDRRDVERLARERERAGRVSAPASRLPEGRDDAR